MISSSFPVNSILDFWFGDCVYDHTQLASQMKTWFSSNPEFDQQIRDLFAHLFDLQTNFMSPHDALAGVILYDQFSRNCFRGQAKAFAFDHLSLDILDSAIKHEWDVELPEIQRAFLYMPLQHAESIERQQQSLTLFKGLTEDCRQEYRKVIDANADYAEQHYALIEKFGRFPHRNKVLGRAATDEEVEYLNSGGKRFGQ